MADRHDPHAERFGLRRLFRTGSRPHRRRADRPDARNDPPAQIRNPRGGEDHGYRILPGCTARWRGYLCGIRSLARRQPRDGDPGVDALTKSGAPSCKGRIGTGSRGQGRQWRSTRRRYRAFNTVHRAIRHPRGTQRMTTSPHIKKSNPAGLLFSIGDGTAARLGRYQHGLSQPGISCW